MYLERVESVRGRADSQNQGGGTRMGLCYKSMAAGRAVTPRVNPLSPRPGREGVPACACRHPAIPRPSIASAALVLAALTRGPQSSIPGTAVEPQHV